MKWRRAKGVLTRDEGIKTGTHTQNWKGAGTKVALCSDLIMGGDFSGYSRISRFRYLSESNQNGVEMHFECDFSHFRIQSVNWPHPCLMDTVVGEVN